MEYPPSNGVVIDNEDLKKALVDKIYDEQSKATRTNFRAALAGEIMASLSGTAYGFNDGSVNWDVVAKDAIDAADALIAKLEEK